MECWSDGLMSLSGMVEMPRPFDGAQGMLQAERKSVMPANAGIQCGGVGAKTQNLDSRFRGKDGRGSRLPVDVMKSLGFEPGVV